MARTKRKSKRPSSVLQVTTTGSRAAPTGLPAGAFFLFGGLCLLMAGWGLLLLFGWLHGVLFTGNDRFELHRIETRTDGTIPEAVLEEWSGLQSGMNLYELELPALRKRLEDHAIIRKAVVRRKLPDTLEISVNERVPIARMGRVEGRMNWLIDRDGVLIRKSFKDKQLPFLLGVPQDVVLGDTIAEGPAGPALRYIEAWRVLPSKMKDLLQFYAISVGNPDYLDVRTRDGFSILLPRDGDAGEELHDAARTVFEILQAGIDKREINQVPNGPNTIVGPN